MADVKLGSMYAELGVDTKKLHTAGREIMTFTSGARQRLGSLIGTVGKLGASFAALAGAGGIASSIFMIGKWGASFETVMTQVRGITGATEKQFQELTAIAKHMGETTEWSASQAGESLKFLAMAGFEVEEAMGALPHTLDLATAGQIDLGRAADIASNAMTAFKLETEDLSMVNDVFLKTTTSTNTNIEMMAESFKYSAPIAKGYGYTIQELSAMIGLLGNAGIQGSMAGTQLAMAIQKTGESFKDAEGKSMTFVQALEKMEKEQWEADEVMDVFGQRSGRAALALLGMSGEIRKLTGELENSKGVTNDLASMFRDTFTGAMKEVKSVMEGIGIDIFNQFAEEAKNGLKDFADYLRENKKNILDWTNTAKDAFMQKAPEYMDTFLDKMEKLKSAATYNTDIIEYGLIGWFLFGKKGAALIGGGAHLIEAFTNSVRGLFAVMEGEMTLEEFASSDFKELEARLKGIEESTTDMTQHFRREVASLEREIDRIWADPDISLTDKLFQTDELEKRIDHFQGIIQQRMEETGNLVRRSIGPEGFNAPMLEEVKAKYDGVLGSIEEASKKVEKFSQVSQRPWGSRGKPKGSTGEDILAQEELRRQQLKKIGPGIWADKIIKESEEAEEATDEVRTRMPLMADDVRRIVESAMQAQARIPAKDMFGDITRGLSDMLKTFVAAKDMDWTDKMQLEEFIQAQQKQSQQLVDAQTGILEAQKDLIQSKIEQSNGVAESGQELAKKIQEAKEEIMKVMIPEADDIGKYPVLIDKVLFGDMSPESVVQQISKKLEFITNGVLSNVASSKSKIASAVASVNNYAPPRNDASSQVGGGKGDTTNNTNINVSVPENTSGGGNTNAEEVARAIERIETRRGKTTVRGGESGGYGF